MKPRVTLGETGDSSGIVCILEENTSNPRLNLSDQCEKRSKAPTSSNMRLNRIAKASQADCARQKHRVNASLVQAGPENLTHGSVSAIKHWGALTEKTILYTENFVAQY